MAANYFRDFFVSDAPPARFAKLPPSFQRRALTLLRLAQKTASPGRFWTFSFVVRHRGFLQILNIRDEGGFLKASLVLMANPACPRTPLATTGDISVTGTDVKCGIN